MLSGQNICFNDPQNGFQVYVKPPFPVLVVFTVCSQQKNTIFKSTILLKNTSNDAVFWFTWLSLLPNIFPQIHAMSVKEYD